MFPRSLMLVFMKQNVDVGMSKAPDRFHMDFPDRLEAAITWQPFGPDTERRRMNDYNYFLGIFLSLSCTYLPSPATVLSPPLSGMTPIPTNALGIKSKL